MHIHTWGCHSLHTFLLLLFAEHNWGYSDKQPTKGIQWDTHLVVSHSLRPPICLSSNLTLRACKIKLQLYMYWHPRCPHLIHSSQQNRIINKQWICNRIFFYKGDGLACVHVKVFHSLCSKTILNLLQIWPLHSSLISLITCCTCESHAGAQPPASWHASPMYAGTATFSTANCHCYTHSDTAPGHRLRRCLTSDRCRTTCVPLGTNVVNNTHRSGLWNKERGQRITLDCSGSQILAYLLPKTIKID